MIKKTFICLLLSSASLFSFPYEKEASYPQIFHHISKKQYEVALQELDEKLHAKNEDYIKILLLKLYIAEKICDKELKRDTLYFINGLIGTK